MYKGTEVTEGIRTLDKAQELYVGRRANLTEVQRAILADTEGRKFFRFGNSWRRRNPQTGVEMMIFDDCDDIYVWTPDGAWEF